MIGSRRGGAFDLRTRCALKGCIYDTPFVKRVSEARSEPNESVQKRKVAIRIRFSVFGFEFGLEFEFWICDLAGDLVLGPCLGYQSDGQTGSRTDGQGDEETQILSD